MKITYNYSSYLGEYLSREEVEKALKEQRKEILDCLSEKRNWDNTETFVKDFDEGYNDCREEFLNNIKQKGL